MKQPAIRIWRATEWINILIYGALVYEMFRLWTMPGPDDFSRIQTLGVLMGLEFILVQSGIFMLLMPRKTSLLFLLPVYGIVAYFLNTGAEKNTILYLYFGVMLTRFRFLFSDIRPEERKSAIKLALIAGAIYMISLIVIIGGETSLPAKGLSQDFLQSNGYFENLKIWVYLRKIRTCRSL